MSAFDKAKTLLAEGKPELAFAALRDAVLARPSYLDETAGARLAPKLAAALARRLEPLKLAVLGSTTTAQLVPLLKLHALVAGFDAEIYEAPHGTFRQEILDPKSRLYAFKPQAALLFVNYRDEDEPEAWAALWKTLRERARCAVLMNNFDAPAERPGGNLDERLARLRARNARLAELARGGAALLVDQDHLSSVVGKENWHDERFWLDARQAIALPFLPRYAAEVAAVLSAAFGRAKKCLVLDLDNTLWGGIVGDDGVDGVELGGSARGEAFAEFQRYLKRLSERGVLLAVCSKNEDKIAREPFEKRAEMVLKLKDFAVFLANWDDKATGLRKIARKLNIGLDALAFADDNPAERELVRGFCPEVAVVDLPEDPADYVRTLDRARLFESAGVSDEDKQRAAHFHAEGSRAALQAEAPDLESFLKGLEMRAVAGPFEERDVARVTQLINKTNQFNLTTIRRTEAEVRALMADPKVWTLSIRLADRLGDSGLISVLIARAETERFVLDTWLMSCRVLGRGVEKLALNRALEAARAARCKTISARYLPTPKNGLVKDLLKDLGFEKDGDFWALAVAKAKPLEVAIRDGPPAASR